LKNNIKITLREKYLKDRDVLEFAAELEELLIEREFKFMRLGVDGRNSLSITLNLDAHNKKKAAIQARKRMTHFLAEQDYVLTV